jgi:hypothetical protein
VLPGYHRGRVRPFYLPVIPLYGFTKLYTNPFLLIYLLPNFKLPVLVPIWGLKQKKLNSGSHNSMDNGKAFGGYQRLGWIHHGLVRNGRLGFNSKLLRGLVWTKIRGGFWILRGSKGISTG